MKVVILCGGQGTRLREETGRRPKPMVLVGDRPILWHIMKGYAQAGHNEFVLCLGYLGEKIKEYFLHYEAMNSDVTVTLGRGEELRFHHPVEEEGWQVTLANTGQDTLTGGRVARIQRYVDGETFCLTYGDGVSDVDLKALVDFHRAHGKLATVTGVRPPGRFGELALDGDTVTSFMEKPELSGGYINGGFFVFEPRVFDYLSTDASCILERDPLERLAADGELMMYRHDDFWQCVDTYRDLTLINKLWESGDAPWKSWA